MASIRKIGDKYRVEIRKKGIYKSATFDLKADAEEWERKIEREIDRGAYQLEQKNEPMTLKKALQDYLEKITPRKKGAAREKNRILNWQKHPLAKKNLNQITGKDLADYRDTARAAGLKEPSIRIELMLLSSIFEVCRKDWGHTGLNNPVKDITLPKQSSSRKRRLEKHELDYLIAALPDAQGDQKNVRELILLALETGMRQGELLKIEWADVDLSKKLIHLDDTKSGDFRNVPLSAAAIEILKAMNPEEKKKGKIFNIIQDTLIRVFSRACQIGYRTAVEDGVANAKFLANLHFHDLRHEAASRWANKLHTHQLCKMFGWKTPSMAMRYYHEDATQLAEMLDS